MTRYRFKIDTPWGKKGHLCPIRMQAIYGDLKYISNDDIYPELWPDIFELMPELDPVMEVMRSLPDILSKVKEYNPYSLCTSSGHHFTVIELKAIFEKFIEAGLNPERLK